MRTGDKAVSGALVASGAMVWDYAQWGHDKAVIKPLSKWVAVGLLLVLGYTQHRKTGDRVDNVENRDYLLEWRELMAKNSDEVLESWTDWDGKLMVRTVEDRRYSVAGIFAIEGWNSPPSMDEYII